MQFPQIIPKDLLIQWVRIAPGAFSARDLSQDTTKQQLYISLLEELLDEGHIDRYGKNRGWYIPRQVELEPMDYKGAAGEPVDIWLPFELSDLVEIYESNVIIISGAPNSGKTAVKLNIIKENEGKDWDIHYFNSEMSASELRVRLEKFYPERALSDWQFNAYYRNNNFEDVIVPGPNALNIIDFLEIHDEFYAVGAAIKRIADRLKGGIAVIGLQKNANTDLGLGGWRSMERTRLAIALDFQRVKITKAKNFRDSSRNPNGYQRDFKLRDGCHIQETSGWKRAKNGKE